MAGIQPTKDPVLLVTDKDNIFKRAGIALLVLVLLAVVASVYRQSLDNGDAISSLSAQLSRANHQLALADQGRDKFRDQVLRDSRNAHKTQQTAIAFLKIFQKQNEELVRAGLPPVSLQPLTSVPHSQPSATPTPTPSKPHSKPKPSPTARSSTQPTSSPVASPSASASSHGILCRLLSVHCP